MAPAIRVLMALALLAFSSCGDESPAITSPDAAPNEDDSHPAHPADSLEHTARYEAAWIEAHSPMPPSIGCSGYVVGDRGPFDGTVFLTFDDGPNPLTTPDIVRVLREHDVPATFFHNGYRLTAAGNAVTSDIVSDARFGIANHSQDHVNLANRTPEEVAAQIDLTQHALVELGAAPHFFRFPYGSATCAAMDVVVARSMMSVGWHVDSADWCFAAGAGYCAPETFSFVPDEFRYDMIGFVLAQLAERNGGVVLFHDVHRNTANSLADVIDALRAAGYTFGRLDDATLLPITNGPVGTYY